MLESNVPHTRSIAAKLGWMHPVQVAILCLLFCPAAAPAQETLWKTYIDAGMEAYNEKEFAEAEKRFSIARQEAETFGEQNPKLAVTFIKLALVSLAQEKDDEAASFMQKALLIWEKNLGPEPLVVADYLDELAFLYYRTKKYTQAEPLFKLILSIRKQHLKSDDLKLAESYRMLAHIHYNNDEYPKAAPLYEQVLVIVKKVLGDDHPDVATRLDDLADCYRAQKKYGQAEPLYRETLAVREKAVGTQHPDVADVLKDLASNYANQNQHAAAEPFYQRALAIYEKVYGAENLTTLGSILDLADLYRVMKRDEAEALYKQALKISEQVWKNSPLRIADLLLKLSDYYKDRGKDAEAEPVLERIAGIYKEEWGAGSKKHLNLLSQRVDNYQRQNKRLEAAQTYRLMAYGYWEAKKYADAESFFKRALEIQEKLPKIEPKEFVSTLWGLAGLYRAQGEYAAAEPPLKRIIVLLEQAEGIGPNHEDVADYLSALGVTYQAQEKYSEAEEVSKRALAIRESKAKIDEPALAQSFNNLAKIKYALGKYSEAEPLYHRAIAMSEKLGEKSRFDLAWYQKNYALLLYAQNKKAQAEPLFLKSLETLKEDKTGESRVATSLFELAELYRRQEKYAEARPIFEGALALREKALGKDHLDVATVLEKYAALLRKVGREGEAAQLIARAQTIRTKHAH